MLAAPGRPSVVELAGTAAEIWDSVVAEGSEEAAVSALASRYAVHPRQLSDDVRNTIDDLRDRGLLVHGW